MMLSPDTVEHTFRHMPTGGVTKPIARPVINTAPNWIGETPSNFNAGRKTGVSNRIAGLTSTKKGAVRGYNPSKLGRASHHPLIAFVADTRMIANCWVSVRARPSCY